jgi:tetratricopeptide (TPR) repeat protein
MTGRSTLVLLFVFVTLAARPAFADDRNAAREAFRRGSQHYKLGEFKEALQDFKAAFRAYEDPTFLFNIAQCERQLDQREEAVRQYKMYLAEAPDAANRDEVKAVVARLEHELEEQRARDRALAAEKATPPVSVLPPQPAPEVVALTTTTPPPARVDKPVYKKWWLWTIVGVAVAGGVAAGVAVALTQDPKQHVSTALGTFQF